MPDESWADGEIVWGQVVPLQGRNYVYGQALLDDRHASNSASPSAVERGVSERSEPGDWLVCRLASHATGLFPECVNLARISLMI
ncbi:MAG: hypothetical protein KDA80_14095 [Planctomycetaceae bacterium]|nr:hypothetical protein [Planctomycetaceae bacterium]